MKKINREDIIENKIHTWECPCGYHNDDFEDPRLKEVVFCEGCQEDVEIKN